MFGRTINLTTDVVLTNCDSDVATSTETTASGRGDVRLWYDVWSYGHVHGRRCRATRWCYALTAMERSFHHPYPRSYPMSTMEGCRLARITMLAHMLAVYCIYLQRNLFFHLHEPSRFVCVKRVAPKYICRYKRNRFCSFSR